MEEHVEWNGKVELILVNQAGADIGVPSCSTVFSHPIVQDDATGATWAGLSGAYDTVLVIDHGAILGGRISPFIHPDGDDQIVALVKKLLD